MQGPLVTLLTTTVVVVGLWVIALWAFTPADHQRATLDVKAAGGSASAPAKKPGAGDADRAGSSNAGGLPGAPSRSPQADPRPSAPSTPAVPVPVLSAGSIDLGADATRGSVLLLNPSGAAIAWSAAPSTSAITAQPSSGELPPGGQTELTLVLERSGVDEGSLVAQVDITSAGGGRVLSVVATVERAPVIDAMQVAGGRAWLDPRCGDTTPALSAKVSDDSRLATVDMIWVGPGGFGRLHARRGQYGRWSADLPSQPRVGEVAWRVEATDSRGNIGRGTAQPLSIDDCSR